MTFPVIPRSAYFRLVRDLVAATLRQSLPGHGPDLHAGAWTAATRIGGPDLPVDSLQLLELATAVNRYFHLYDSGIEDNLLRFRQLGEWAEIVERARLEGSRDFAFRSSGSTGQPVEIAHTEACLLQEAQFLAHLFSRCRRVVSFVPAHHAYGFLTTVLMPAIRGMDVIDAEVAAPGTCMRQLRDGDLLVGHPLIWRLWSGLPLRLPGGVHAVTSTAPCEPEWMEALHAVGLESLTELYGSTETAGVGFREHLSQPFRLFPWWQFARQTEGAWILRRLAPDGSAREMPAMDRLQRVGEDRFCFEGREDHRVQVGGVNVSPSGVARKIGGHPLVAACHVRKMRPDEGERLKAFIVPAQGRPLSHDERNSLSQWMRGCLSGPEFPALLSFGPALPVTPEGKLRDWLKEEGWPQGAAAASPASEVAR